MKYLSLISTFLLLSALFISSVSNEYDEKSISTRGRLYQVVYTPDGSQLIIATSFGVEFRDSETLELMRTLYENVGSFQAIAITKGGKYIAVASESKIFIWDLLADREHKQITVSNSTEHNSRINSLNFSADGKFLVAGSDDNLVYVFSTITGNQFATMSHQKAVLSVAISADGSYIASASEDRTVKVWTMGSYQLLRTFTGFSAHATSVAFSPDSRYVAGSSRDGTIRVWEVATAKPFAVISTSVSSMNVVIFESQGKYLIGGSNDRTLRLWILPNTTPVQEIPTSITINSLASHPKGNFIALGSVDGTLLIQPIKTEAPLLAETRDIKIDKKPQTSLTTVDTSTRLSSSAVPPVIMIVSPMNGEETNMNTISLKARIASTTTLQNIEIRVNGKLINDGENRDLKVKSKTETKQAMFYQDITFSIPIQSGENKIELYVKDSNNLDAKEVITVYKREFSGKVWAVVIGIGKYKNVNQLRYTVSDAMAFKEYLVNYNAVPDSQITMILDEEATVERLRRVLGTDLKRKAGKNDMVIIFFAGHGATEPDPNNVDGDGLEKYLLPCDANPEDLYSTALPMQEIATIFGRISAERLIFIADACYSGASGGRTILSSRRATIHENFLERLTKAKGRVILSASSANEVSMEADKLSHGVFTYYLLEGLKGNADYDNDKYISVDEIYRYVSEKVPSFTGQNQHPVKKGEVEGNLIIGTIEKK